MSERTEKPTKEKLKREKEKGIFPKSYEFASGLLVFGGVVILWGLSGVFGKKLKEIFFQAYGDLNALQSSPLKSFSHLISPFALPMLGLLLGVFCLAIAAHFFQTGFVWQVKKSNRKKREKRFFFPLFKVLGLGLSGYLAIRYFKFPAQVVFATSEEKAALLFRHISSLLIGAASFLLFLGVCDYFYQRWKFYKKMHMTRQESKDDRKESEGDKETKRKMRGR